MKVKAKATFRTEVDGKLYHRGQEYDITEKLFDKWRNHFVSLEPEKKKEEKKEKESKTK